MKKHIIFLAGILCLVSGICFSASQKVWKNAPNFRLEKAAGGSVTLKQLNSGGSVVVLSFFDTSCAPCLKELPHLKNLYNKYLKDTNVKIRLISLDENKEALSKYIKQHRVNIPVLRDPGGWKAGSNYGVVRAGRAEIPQVFVIGKNGKIRKHLQGYHADIEAVLTKTIVFLKKEKVVKPKIRQVTVLYTNSANGYLESCDCPENPFGGLVRRMTAIKDLRKKYPGAVLLDSGDNFAARENKLLAEYVLKMMGLMNYDAVAIGDQEFILGIDYLEKNIKKLPFISANISRCDETKCWDIAGGYKIKEVSGVKVAIISIISPDIFVLFPRDKIKMMKIENHIETLKGMVPSLRDKADILIVVSHSGDEEDRKIAEEVSGIDLIVGGHSQTLHKQPMKIGNTLIVQAGKDGHRIGRLTFKLDANKKIKTFAHEQILLIKGIPDDKIGRKLIEEYKTKVKQEAGKVLIK